MSIGATAADNRSVQKVEFFVNNTLKCTVMSAPYTCLWSVPAQVNVTYTMKARAHDASGNTANATAKVTSK